MIRKIAVIAIASLLVCLSYIIWGKPALTYTAVCVEADGDSLQFIDGVTIYGGVEGSECHTHWGMMLKAIYTVNGNRVDLEMDFWRMSDDSPIVILRGKTVSLPQGVVLTSAQSSLSVNYH
jgi:hypothetical protein